MRGNWWSIAQTGFLVDILVTSKPLQEELYKLHPHKNSGRFCSNRELEEIDKKPCLMKESAYKVKTKNNSKCA